MSLLWVSLRAAALAASSAWPRAARALGGAALSAFAAFGASASEITIAVAGPDGGPNADRTRAIWDGAQAAASTLNHAGGVRGTLIRLMRKDDACSSEGAKRAAEDLAALRVDLVIGHPCSGAAESAAKIYAEKGILFIATSSRHPGLTERRAGASIFRLAGRDDRQAEAAAAFLLDRFAGKSIAIAHDRTQYARTLGERVSKLIADARGAAPEIAKLVAGELDFPRVTAKIKDADAVFFAGFPLEAGMLYAQLRATGSTAAMVFSDSVGSAEFVTTFGPEVREAYVLRARFGIGGDPDALQEDQGERLRAGDRANARAALEAFAAAAERADTLAPDKVQILLNGYLLPTPSGVIRFDRKGDAERPSFDILKWTGYSWEGLTASPLGSVSRERSAR